jgi:hypothetical protein
MILDCTVATITLDIIVAFYTSVAFLFPWLPADVIARCLT